MDKFRQQWRQVRRILNLLLHKIGYAPGVVRFFGEISSNGCRPPVTAGVSWWSATVGGCRVHQSPMQGLSRLRETNSQWEGVPIGNGDFRKCRLRPSTKFEVRRFSCSEDTTHLVCQLSIYNSFPVIRTTIAKKSSFYVPRPSFFLFALETPLRWSRKTLHKWKDNSVLAKSLAAGTHLSSTVS